jgi:hypothetical protein
VSSIPLLTRKKAEKGIGQKEVARYQDQRPFEALCNLEDIYIYVYITYFQRNFALDLSDTENIKFNIEHALSEV